jgi:hypothetical protein
MRWIRALGIAVLTLVVLFALLIAGLNAASAARQAKTYAIAIPSPVTVSE